MKKEVEELKRPEIVMVYEGLVNRKVDKWLIPLIIILFSLAFASPLIFTIVEAIIENF